MKSTTNKQTHRIKRLRFEINIEQQSQASQLHSEVSRICQRQITALLERCLAQVGVDRLLRIDSLELDLGTVDPANMETEMLQQLEQQINRVLPIQLKQAQASDEYGADARIQSRLEMLSVYARKGHLPWWVGSTQSEPLSETLGELLDEAPPALAPLIQELLRDETAQTRIVRRCNDSVLAQLGGYLCPPQAKVVKRFTAGLTALLQSVPQGSIAAVSRHTHPRQLVWQALLYTASGSATRPTSNPAFWRDVLLRLAILMQSRYDSLLYDLHRCLERSRPDNVPESFHKLLARLYKELPVPVSPSNAAPAVLSEEQFDVTLSESKVADWSTLVQLLEGFPMRNVERASRQAAAIGTAIKKLIREGEPLSARLQQHLHKFSNLLQTILGPAQLRELYTYMHIAQRAQSESIVAWRKLLQLLHLFENEQDRKEPQAINKLIDHIDTLMKAGIAPPADDLARLLETESLWRKLLNPEQLHSFKALLQFEPQTQARMIDLAEPSLEKNISTDPNQLFSEFDEAYVENAGLVILWPFLERFFDRLDLLHEKRFRDEATAQRAVALLQYLVTEDSTPAEYLLPLNKVLCGMQPDALFDFDSSLQAEEQDECQHLLQAAIEHATILRKMSMAGFRGSFLLRKGLLESRDGAWLLRVERETHDVVLDRFPWSFGWVKLPWMKTQLRVEW